MRAFFHTHETAVRLTSICILFSARVANSNFFALDNFVLGNEIWVNRHGIDSQIHNPYSNSLCLEKKFGPQMVRLFVKFFLYTLRSTCTVIGSTELLPIADKN